MSNKKSNKNRTQVKSLPRKEKKLGAQEAKRVKGGFGVEREMKESGEKGGTEDIQLTDSRTIKTLV